MSSEGMGRVSDRLLRLLALCTVLFLGVLAISPIKDFRREWRQYKRSYVKYA